MAKSPDHYDAITEAGVTRLAVTYAHEITHACPVSGEAVTRCCGRTPFELPRTDRLTLDAQSVTCRGHAL